MDMWLESSRLLGVDFWQGGRDEEVHLRLERAGEQLSAYCSVDGENWLKCGKLALPLDAPLKSASTPSE